MNTIDYTLEADFDRMLQDARERGGNQIVITKALVQRLRREFGLTKINEDHEDYGIRHGNYSLARRKHTRNLRISVVHRLRICRHRTY